MKKNFLAEITKTVGSCFKIDGEENLDFKAVIGIFNKFLSHAIYQLSHEVEIKPLSYVFREAVSNLTLGFGLNVPLENLPIFNKKNKYYEWKKVEKFVEIESRNENLLI